MDYVVDLFVAPLLFFLEPSKRLYWGCLLSSLVCASIAVTWTTKKFDLADQLKALLSKGYWLRNQPPLTSFTCLPITPLGYSSSYPWLVAIYGSL